jgi:hypothetical protein
MILLRFASATSSRHLKFLSAEPRVLAQGANPRHEGARRGASRIEIELKSLTVTQPLV